MKIREARRHIPFFPLSVLIFYIAIISLWHFNTIPTPIEIMAILEKLYHQFGLLGLLFVSLIEGLAYIGLYFPGNSIIALFFIFSDGKFLSVFLMILIVTFALTLSSIINYWMGRLFFTNKAQNDLFKKTKKIEKSIFFSVLHPDLLAFYFFYRGTKKKDFWKILYVPLALIPYGFVFAFAISIFSSFIKDYLIGNPLITLTAISLWFVLAFIYRHKENFLRGINRIYKHLFP